VSVFLLVIVDVVMLSDVLNINFERKYYTAFACVIYNFTLHFTWVILKFYNPIASKTEPTRV